MSAQVRDENMFYKQWSYYMHRPSGR